jgi:hypothetical protein
MRLPIPLSFDWDKGNVEKNWKKHRVHFRDAEEIFFNKPLRTYRDRGHSQKEERFAALGVTNSKRGLYVVFTLRKGKVRIISARDQSKKERRLYAKKEK